MAELRRRPLILITPGDPEGVGPEIVLKALQNPRTLALDCDFVCVGAISPFEKMGATWRSVDPDSIDAFTPPPQHGPVINIIPAPDLARPKQRHGKAGARFSLPGYQSGWSIEMATRLVLAGKANALVTGPISKERLRLGGYAYPGHTEFLAKLCKAKQVTMMLANPTLRVSLVTTHVSIRQISRVLTRAAIRRCILQTADHLRKWWGIARPRIAVAGLNPHAGESGLLGTEEIRLIEPELKSLRREFGDALELQGPLPSDTLFAKHVMARQEDRFDAVVCMYHDQGLIPVKLIDFPNTVNVTLGLPIVRTSVDHGVGFDIAGKGIADPSSLLAALSLALRLGSRKKMEALK